MPQSATIKRVKASAFDAFRPPARLPLSKFIERHIRLPAGLTATPGRVRLLPYQRAIADAISDPNVDTIVWQKPARVGATFLMASAIANFIKNDPASILAVQPRQDDCRSWMATEIEPIYEASPAMRSMLTYNRNDETRNTLLSRQFPGGNLRIVPAGSPAGFRRYASRVGFCDEVDAYPVTDEGDTIDLVRRRLATFPDKKLVLASTPIHAETSKICEWYDRSDQRQYHAKCIHCEDEFLLAWACLQWPENKPDQAALICPHCGGVHDDQQRLAAVAGGRWIAQKPFKGIAGFQNNVLVAPFVTNVGLADEFLQAKQNTDSLQVFVNTTLGEPWREVGDDVASDDLLDRVEQFGPDTLPVDALFLTVGADVQRDRIECSLLGHSPDGVMVIEHVILWGDPQDVLDPIWSELDQYLRRSYVHPNGGRLPVHAALIDSGDGGTTRQVYTFCKPRNRRRVFACKGRSGFDKPFFSLPLARQQKAMDNARVVLVGTELIKREIMRNIRKEPGKPGAMRFSETLGPDYFDQLTSEYLKKVYRKGVPVLTFERKAGRNAECLDCAVYGISAANYTPRVDWKAFEAATHAGAKTEPKITDYAALSRMAHGHN